MIQFTPEEKDLILAFCGFILISNYLIRIKEECSQELENERIENSYEFILESFEDPKVSEILDLD